MKDIPVARRYARALLEAVKDSGRLDSVAASLKDFVGMFEASRELRVALENPAVPMAAKSGVLDAVLLKLKTEESVANTARLALRNGRMNLLPAVSAEFEVMANATANRIKVDITTAHPLTPDEEKTLAESLKKFTGKTAVMTVNVDKSLIGGVVARIGSSVYDGSVRNQLKALKVNLG